MQSILWSYLLKQYITLFFQNLNSGHQIRTVNRCCLTGVCISGSFFSLLEAIKVSRVKIAGLAIPPELKKKWKFQFSMTIFNLIMGAKIEFQTGKFHRIYPLTNHNGTLRPYRTIIEMEFYDLFGVSGRFEGHVLWKNLLQLISVKYGGCPKSTSLPLAFLRFFADFAFVALYHFSAHLYSVDARKQNV